MKQYKRVIMCGLVSMCVAVLVFGAPRAYGVNTWQQKANAEIYWIQENLQVTAKQMNEVKACNMMYFAKADSLDAIKDSRLRKRMLDALKKDKDAKFKAILKPQQFEHYLIHTGSDYSQYESPFVRKY